MGLKNSGLIIFLIVSAVTSANTHFSLSDTTQQVTFQDTTSLSGEIDAVTVTAFRAPYNLRNTPAPVNLIVPELLQTGSALTPVEALNQVPGVLMHHGTLSTNRLTIRGIGSRTPYATNKIKAYFGEIPLTSGDGETALEDLENSAIQRVEIIKGPSSSLYGAGLGGTLLFQPKSLKNNFVQHQTTIASFDTYKNTLEAGTTTNNLDLYALGSILNSQGFRENNSTNRGNFLLHSNYSFSEKITLGALLKFTKMKGYIPSSLDSPTFQEHPEKAAANWKGIEGYEAYTKGQMGLSLNVLPGNRNKISLAGFGSFREADEPRPFNLLKENSDYLGLRGYYQKIWNTDVVKTTFTSGIELFREKYNWSTWSNDNPENALSNNSEKRAYENLFAQLELNFSDSFFLSAGTNANLTRFDYTDNFPDDGDQSGERSYKPVISPRIGANYKVSGTFSVFGNASHGFSTPSFEETLLPEGQINPDIKPESGWNLEAGIRANWNNRLQATVSYYRIYIKNLLVARRTGEDAYVGVNAGKSLHPGLEAALRWELLNPATYPSLVLSGNATIANYHFQDFVDGDNDYSGNLLPGTTRNTWLLAVNFSPVENIQMKAWHRFTGKMPVDDANSDFTESYGLTNFEAAFNKNFGSIKLELKAGVQNIFDVHHAAMLAVNAPSFGGSLPRYYYPGNPRNYFVSVLLGWRKR
ncbi:iron complex outermembrane recepter protein [Tangfeifania diversioriginum]|uniref:Iron complex outermembrane recepter protein n=1 Tax=Tangfeifania diversioriginum TaxID=1168035 RepID=A0A1M6CKP5_9BACT|nr:TonB-dependent receptor [Tangfeifania diversioriginum]SHI61288.1 iron complex outermembrane recepter protein [Tangfeifania diversioriginum]